MHKQIVICCDQDVCDVVPLEHGVGRLAGLVGEHRKRVQVAVILEVLPDQLVNEEIFLGELGLAGAFMLERSKYFGTDFGLYILYDENGQNAHLDLGKDAALVQGLLEYGLQVFEGGHDVVGLFCLFIYIELLNSNYI